MTDTKNLPNLSADAGFTDSYQESVSPYLSEEYADHIHSEGFKEVGRVFDNLLSSFDEKFDYVHRFKTDMVSPEVLVEVKAALRRDCLLLAGVIEEFIENKFDNITERPLLIVLLNSEHLIKKDFSILHVSPGVNDRKREIYEETWEWLKANDKNFDDNWSEFDKSLYIILHLVNEQKIEFEVLTLMLFSLINITIHQLKNAYEGELDYPEDGVLPYLYARIVYEVNTAYNLIKSLLF